MRRLALAALALWALPAQAAGLTAADRQYLQATFGVAPDAPALLQLDAAGQQRLHDAINDPSSVQYPIGRALSAGGPLFQAIVACQAHTVPKLACLEPKAGAAAVRGYEVADRSCNGCHLTGTAEAPAFFKLVRRPGWSDAALGGALAAGHRMSPISLAPAELADLTAWLDTLK